MLEGGNGGRVVLRDGGVELVKEFAHMNSSGLWVRVASTKPVVSCPCAYASGSDSEWGEEMGNFAILDSPSIRFWRDFATPYRCKPG